MNNNFPRFDLQGQIALVTGAARGIGHACALALANAGADVALGLRDVQTGDDLASEIEAMGRGVLKLQMDITRLDEIQEAVASTVSHFGRLDILVNNAGLGPSNLAENVREEDFDLTLTVNLKGTFFVSQAAGRVMIKQNYGRIINLGSQAGSVALPTESVYCMTKAAISHLTKCLAVEWGQYNITVNAVAPTFINTPGTAEALGDATFRADVLSRIALGRIGEPMEVASAVVFLASPAASLITGVFTVLRGVLDTTMVALLYLIPLGIITARWGLGPGILSAFVAFLAFNYFFIEPHYTFTVHRAADIVILVVFLVVAVVISQLVGQAQAGLAAATAREREATQLYELSTALAGLPNDHAIVQILAKQVHAVAEGEYVELNIKGTRPFSVRIPERNSPARPAELILPIEAAR